MNYNYLPSSSLQVSEISLGTMMFGGQTAEADALKIMDYAYTNGVNLFDTADVYNWGASEEIVAKGLKGRRGDIVLATKVGQTGRGVNDEGLSRRHIFRACEASLKRLDTDYIDIYYLHKPDYLTDIEETLSAMNDLVRAGKIRYIGLSNYAAWQMADILALCDKRGYDKPVITQVVYNALTRGIEQECVPFVQAHKMAITNFNPIAGGLLSGKHKPGKPAENTRFSNNAGYFARYWDDENFDAVERLSRLAADNGLSILELAMRFCVSQRFVTTVLSGVSRLEHIEQNIASVGGGALSKDILDACDAVWKSLAGNRFTYNR